MCAIRTIKETEYVLLVYLSQFYKHTTYQFMNDNVVKCRIGSKIAQETTNIYTKDAKACTIMSTTSTYDTL